MINQFSDYWNKKAKKRRKGWSSKARQFKEKHATLEVMRNHVFLPFSHHTGFDDYMGMKRAHYCRHNPICEWKQGVFSFSKNGLYAAMTQHEADLDNLKWEVTCEHIQGKTAPEPDTLHKDWEFRTNLLYRLSDSYHEFLKWIYGVATDAETVSLHYRQITMTIRRYTIDDLPFAFYELNPCEELSLNYPMLMQETEFYLLNVATLLMEMAAEYELRQEELNYYAKALKIRTIEAAISDKMEFKLWDDKKLDKQLKLYAAKGLSLDKVMKQVLRPWTQAVKALMTHITERDCDNQKLDIPFYVYVVGREDLNRRLQTYFDSIGLQDANVSISDGSIIIEYQGYKSILKITGTWMYINPYPYFEEDFDLFPKHAQNLIWFRRLTLSAIAEYVKQMPEINKMYIDDMIDKVSSRYQKL